MPINTIDAVFLDRFALCLEERFLASVQVERSLVVPRSALNATRQQLFLATLTSKVLRAFPEDAGILLAITDYGGPVVAFVASGNRAGTQFHAEKSQAVGLRILLNFLLWSP